jgi:hypothetical protein
MKQEPPTASQGPLRGAPLLVTYLGGFPPKSAPLIVCHVIKEWASVRPIASARGSIRRVYLFYSVRVVALSIFRGRCGLVDLKRSKS